MVLYMKQSCILNYELLTCLRKDMNGKYVQVVDKWHMMWPIGVISKLVLFEKIIEQNFEILI